MNELSKARDSYLFVESGRVRMRGPRHRLGLTLSSFKYTNPDPLAVDIGNEVIDARNTNLLRRDASGTVTGYASGFNLVDFIADGEFKTGRAQYPVSITADFVKNLAATTGDDAGFWLETQYGAAEALRTFSLGYTFARIEQDAVLAPFLFDDMLGTNATMHLASLSYVPLRNLNVDLNLVFSRWLKPRPDDNPNLLTRAQLSARVRF